MIETENSEAVTRIQPKGLRQLYLAVTSSSFVRYGLLLLTSYVLLRSIVYAAIKPFWFDEVLTFVVSRQGTLSGIRAALNAGIDGNPPAFYLAEHWAASLVSNEHVGYRLLSILGFAGILLLVFVFIRTRYGSPVALLSSAILLLTPLFTLYAQEARPYSLVVAFLALAMVCYQRTPHLVWTFGLSLSLTLAALFHYYIVLAFAPFFLAEAAFSYFARRLRWGVWLALLVPLIPVMLSWPRLVWMKHTWGPHFWAGAALNDVSAAYGDYFRVGSSWGMALCGLTLLLMLTPLWQKVWTRERTEQDEAAGIHEQVLIAGLAALPLLGFAVAKVSHGPFLERYFLPCILGFVVAAAFAFRLAGATGFFASAVFVLLAISSQEVGFWKARKTRQTAGEIISPVVTLANMSQYPELPIVVSDPGTYVEMWHYAPSSLFQRVFTFPHPSQAAAFLGIDTVDRIVLALRPYGSGGIQDFSTFISTHPKFLLYSDGSKFDWLPSRLLRDGYQLRLVDRSIGPRFFLVEPPGPQRSSRAAGALPQNADVPSAVAP